MAHLDVRLLEDITHQLKCNYKAIGFKYASYVRCIRTSLKEKKNSANELCSFLLELPFEYDQSTVTGLKKAETIDNIFIALGKFFSFWDHEVFEFMIDEYDLDKNNEKLQYTEHFVSYIQSHKVSEFVKINPLLSKYIAKPGMTTLVLDVNITQCSLSKVGAFKEVVATSLDVKPTALRLLNSSEAAIFFSSESTNEPVMSNNNTNKENLAASGKLTVLL